MEVAIDNKAEVAAVGSLDVAVSNAADVVVTDDSALDITVTKKEYKIVGDEVYIAKLYEDAPQWMKDLVQLVVDNTMASESTALLNNLVSQLNKFATSYVPLNTYTQSILDLSNADQSLHANLETLNSNFNDGLNTTNSQIINLKLTKASKDEVTTEVVETLAAQLLTPTSALGSTIGNLQRAIVNGDSANADSITALTSTLEGEVDARATAVEYLNTYVGITEVGIPTGTGLLANVVDLQEQVDNKIESWYTLSTSDPKSAWTTAALKLLHNGDMWYQTDTKNSYYYTSSTDTWNVLQDATALQALANAATAQATADGVVESYYAQYQDTAPATSSMWLNKTGTKVLKEYVGGAWSNVSVKVGDTLTAYDVTTKDISVFVYYGGAWVSNTAGGLVANSNAVTSLSTELNNGINTWAAADSSVVNSLTTTINNGDAAVQAKWAYNSTVAINGVYKKSGFGLTSNYSGGSGTENDPYISEFWIDATKLKFTNSATTGRTAPFTIDASGTTPQITFNGKVSFSNVTDVPQLGSTPQEVVNAVNAGNTTTINGGRITTGSITANQIATNTITGDMIYGGVIYNLGGTSSNYTMKIDLINGEIHIR